MKSSPVNAGTHQERAFSLIEVLIAVLILSLGLLGLASVFPVVVRQQRLAGDATQGSIVAQFAESYLRSHALLNQPSLASPPAGTASLGVTPLKNPQMRRGWDLLRYANLSDSNTQAPSFSYRGWQPDGSTAPRLPNQWNIDDHLTGHIGELRALRTDDYRGDFYPVGRNLLNNPVRFYEEPRIPLRDRLWPAPYSAIDQHWQESKYGNEPRFVWDFATLRDEAGTPNIFTDDRILIAVFVRRIDTAMRLPVRDVQDDIMDPLSIRGAGQSNLRPSPGNQQYRGVRIADVLTCNSLDPISATQHTRLLGPDEYRVPVAVDPNAVADRATPTQDGMGNYAALDVVGIESIEDRTQSAGVNYNRIVFPAGLNAARLSLVRQINQRFADNMGNVYTVVKLDEALPNDPDNKWQRSVIVSPSVPPSVRETALLDPTAIELVFSPAPPAAIRVFTLTPR